MSVYTMEQWLKDREFKAEPGQEISADVYDEMLNVMPPEDLPAAKARQALEAYGVPVHAGFLMGEPHSAGPDGRQQYLAFGSNNYGHGARYYYLGLSAAAPELSGVYYFFDCLNAFVNGGLFPAAEFSSEEEAKEMAANYEATLYRYEYRGGLRISSAEIYSPWACFDTEGPAATENGAEI